MATKQQRLDAKTYRKERQRHVRAYARLRMSAADSKIAVRKYGKTMLTWKIVEDMNE